MIKILKIISESVKLAFQELISNKLRSLLSLLGITIGIFCIITIFTGVDFLNKSIEDSIKDLGQEVVYIQKWPWSMSDEYPWWEYIKRPEVDYDNYNYLKDKMQTAGTISYLAFYKQGTLKSENGSISGVNVLGVTPSFAETLALKVSDGRFFTEVENRGSKTAVIGSNVAKELFEGTNPIGQTFRVDGKRLQVIGVFEDNDNLFKFIDFKNDIVLPHEVGRTMFKVSRNSDQWVAAQPKQGITVEQMKDEIRGLMRGTRRIRPTQEDNFAMNRITLILEAVASTQGAMRVAGILLGGLSLLIGGFGVANIMFVSVRERTKYIGIKKAIGAKKWVILLEFLIESIFLCILGSLIGLLLVFLLVFTIGKTFDLNFVLSLKNIGIGIGISIFIGVIAGAIPAYIAANMNPVKAIRS